MNLTRKYKRGIGRVYVDEDDGQEMPSVTTVIGNTLSKGEWLGAWQDNMRKKKFKESGDFAAALAYPNEYRDNAGAVGTFYHSAIEDYLKGEPIDTYIEEDPRAEKVLNNFAKWEEKHELEPVEIEYFLASKRYGYAGTADLVANHTSKHGKSLVLADIKTGSLQVDALLQLAAYSMAYQEIHGQRPDIAFFLKVDVKTGTVKEANHIHYHEISRYFDVFLDVLRIWRWRVLKQF